MITAVLDTNVLLSGILGYGRPSSTPGEIFRRWRRVEYSIIMSDPLLAELEDALTRPYFLKELTSEQRNRALSTIQAYATFVELAELVEGTAPDPDDDHVLAASLNAHADYIVTGDRPLQQIESFHHIPVVTPREFLDVLQSREHMDRTESDADE